MTPEIKKMKTFLDRTEGQTMCLSRREVAALLAENARLEDRIERARKLLKRNHTALGDLLELVGGER